MNDTAVESRTRQLEGKGKQERRARVNKYLPIPLITVAGELVTEYLCAAFAENPSWVPIMYVA